MALSNIVQGAVEDKSVNGVQVKELRGPIYGVKK